MVFTSVHLCLFLCLSLSVQHMAVINVRLSPTNSSVYQSHNGEFKIRDCDRVDPILVGEYRNVRPNPHNQTHSIYFAVAA